MPRTGVLNLPQFLADLGNEIEEVEEKVATVHNRMSRSIYRDVTMQNPVGNPTLWKHPPPSGYVGGRSRASWTMAVDLPDIEVAPELGPYEVQTPKVVAPPFSVTWINNSLPYMVRLEEGWSSQAGEGWVAKVVDEAMAGAKL